jgi:hypothetical protein
MGRAGAMRAMNYVLANGMPRQIRYLAAKLRSQQPHAN